MHRILLVDDDKGLRQIVRDVLVIEGFKVEEAANGLEGVKSFKCSQPDLVILDLNMPEMNGMEATVEMNTINPSVPIIIVTGEKEMISTPDALRIGAHYFLTKPIDFDELLTIINLAISNRDNKVVT